MSKKNKTLENSSSSAIKKDKILITTLSSTDIDFLFDKAKGYKTSPIHLILKKNNEISKVYLIYNCMDTKNMLKGYTSEEKAKEYAAELCDKLNNQLTTTKFTNLKVSIEDIQDYASVYEEFKRVFGFIRENYDREFSSYEDSPFMVNLSSGPQVYHSVLFFLAKNMMLAQALITNSTGEVKTDGDIRFVPQEVLHRTLQKDIAQSVNNITLKEITELIKSYDKDMIVDQSPEMMAIYGMCKSLARFKLTILIYGESGSGKDHIANIIHQFRVSSGKLNPKAPFKAINIAAFPNTLFVSELFGNKKGAFDGAEEKKGLVEEAENGTLFLDEIGELDLMSQSKLLRYIQFKTFHRLGETIERTVNCQIITATNSPVWRGMEVNFRPDLYNRISEFEIEIPPLRKRSLKSMLFQEMWEIKFKKFKTLDARLKKIPAGILRLMESYDWPGNFRELSKITTMILITIGLKDAKSEQEWVEIAKQIMSRRNEFETGSDDIDIIFKQLKTVKWTFAELNEIMGKLKDHAHKIRFRNSEAMSLAAYATEIDTNHQNFLNKYQIKKEDGVFTLVREGKNDNQHNSTSD